MEQSELKFEVEDPRRKNLRNKLDKKIMLIGNTDEMPDQDRLIGEINALEDQIENFDNLKNFFEAPAPSDNSINEDKTPGGAGAIPKRNLCSTFFQFYHRCLSNILKNGDTTR